MSRWLNRFQPWGIFLLRLVLGAAMIVNGSRKVIPRGGFHGGNSFAALQQYANNIATLGIPHWLGYVSAFAEFAGGMFLVLGLLTRFFAFLVAINMIVAIAAVDYHRGTLALNTHSLSHPSPSCFCWPAPAKPPSTGSSDSPERSLHRAAPADLPLANLPR